MILYDFRLPFIPDSRLSSIFSFKEGYGFCFRYNDKRTCVFFSENKEIPSWIDEISKHKTQEWIDINDKHIFIFGDYDDEIKNKIVKFVKEDKTILVSKLNKYLGFWKKVPSKIKDLAISTFFHFAFYINDALEKRHLVIQLQTNYKNNDTRVIVEILKFCRCPTITEELIQEVIRNYILKRADKMKYENVVKSLNPSKKYALIASGNKLELNKIALKVFDELFQKYIENDFNAKM